MMPHTPRLPSAGSSIAGRKARKIPPIDKGGDDTSALTAQFVGEDAGRAAAEEVRDHAGNNQRHAQPAEQEHPDQPAHKGADESHHHRGGAKGEEHRAVNGRDGVRDQLLADALERRHQIAEDQSHAVIDNGYANGELQTGQHREDQHVLVGDGAQVRRPGDSAADKVDNKHHDTGGDRGIAQKAPLF